MAGLRSSAAAFFIFFFGILMTNLAFGCLVKLFAYTASVTIEATKNSGIVLISYIIYSGYIIPLQYMKPWFVWIFYINPIAYGFQTLMINEFNGLQFNCNNTNLVPYGPPFYNDINYQTCSVSGSTPGSIYVDGWSYLSAAFNFNTKMEYWNILINFCIFLIMMVVNSIVLETIRHGQAGASLKLFKKHKRNELKVDPSKAVVEPEIPTGVITSDFEALGALAWTNVKYFVPHPKEKGKTLQLLDNVSAYAKPGTMTALMGSSGAGKTTMLDVVALRKTIGKIEGDITVGPEKQGPEFIKISGYCEQMDVHNRDATVREALRFAAILRQPASVSREEKFAYVEKVIKLLEMEYIADALIGDLDSGVGISMEERKRLTIGIELVSKPKILFLDEPTSGLDAQASMNIIRLLKTLAADGYALLITIHQPSAVLFSQFDRLLLLGRGGRMVYFGELGNDCQTLTGYFEKNGAQKCLHTANPAEYILDCIGAGTAKSENVIDWFQVWKDSNESKVEMDIIKGLRERAANYKKEHEAELFLERERLMKDVPSFRTQTWFVMGRMFRSYWRNPTYNIGRITFQVIAALILGFTFWQVPNTPSGAQNTIFAFFMMCVLAVVMINTVIPMFIQQRSYALREQASGAYGPVSFSIAMVNTEIPFAFIAATAFFVCFYWTVGLNPDPSSILYFYFMYIIFSMWAISLGQLVASMVPNQSLAGSIVPVISSILSLFAGVTITYSQMPTFYSSWLYWIDVYHYFLEGVITNDLYNVPLTCDSSSWVTVNAPANQTCGQYFFEYVKVFGAPGFLQNPSATGVCNYCPVQVGQNVYDTFSYSYDNRTRNICIIIGFWLFNRVMTTVFVRRFKVKR
jgi:ATP-binding cassette, subfamily G (WHITE), member 2, SNQ2